MQRPQIKDPKVAAYVKDLEEEIFTLKELDKVTVYTTIRGQLIDLCEQLKIGPEIQVEIGKDSQGDPIMGKTRIGRIDFFGDKDDKATDRFQKIAPLLFQLEDLLEKKRKEMTETQRERADAQAKSTTGIAEAMALNNGSASAH